jgi:hypothetical protein
METSTIKKKEPNEINIQERAKQESQDIYLEAQTEMQKVIIEDGHQLQQLSGELKVQYQSVGKTPNIPVIFAIAKLKEGSHPKGKVKDLRLSTLLDSGGSDCMIAYSAVLLLLWLVSFTLVVS